MPEFELKFKDEKQARIAGVVFSVVIVAVWFLIFFQPQIKNFKKMYLFIKQTRKEYLAVKKDISRKRELETQKERLSGDLKNFALSLPEQDKIPQILEEVSKIATSSGVKILNIAPDFRGSPDTKAAEMKYYKGVPVSLEIICSYHALGNFINRIENSQFIMRLRNFRITAHQDSPREHKVKLVLDLFVIS
jgi:Tfp pilus assembly protein PilO